MCNKLVITGFLSCLPLYGIVVAGTDPNSALVSYGQVVNGVQMTGVAMITSSIGGCTGTLLMDSFSVLTAGHCVTSSFGSGIATGITVSFLGPGGLVAQSVSMVSVNPGWTGDATQGGDLAVLRLSSIAPAFATGYRLYDDVPTTAPIVIAGYGISGTGLTGANGSFGSLRAGRNQYVVTGSVFSWSSTLLVGEFYQDGVPSTNALGVLDPTPYFAADEVDISHGDSGGPSFLNGELVGVHDLGICLTSGGVCATPPSVNSANNSYFGQLFADVSVSANVDWIEAQMVPEPALCLLVGLGLFMMAGVSRRRAEGASAICCTGNRSLGENSKERS